MDRTLYIGHQKASSVTILSMSLSYTFLPLTSTTIILCSQSVHWLGLWVRSIRKKGRLSQCVFGELFLQWQISQTIKLIVYFHEKVRLRTHGIKLPPSLIAWGQLYTCTRILSAATSSIDSKMYSQGVCDTQFISDWVKGKRAFEKSQHR